MSRPRTADVVVVGAGPAGADRGDLLARAGRSVMLVDKAAFPRDKCCGDGLTTLALRELETLGLDPCDGAELARRSTRRGCGRRRGARSACRCHRRQGMFAATTPRRELDAALVDLARAAGADVRDGHALGVDRRRTPTTASTLDIDGVGDRARAAT